jgi:tetratricopeptide (TPR) repeat protein
MLSPKSAAHHNNRGFTYYLKGNYDRAIEDATTALTLDVREKHAYDTRGRAYLATGNYERALADFNQAIAIDTAYLPAFVGRGKTYEAMGDRDRAIEDYNKALELPAVDRQIWDQQTEATERQGALKGRQ